MCQSPSAAACPEPAVHGEAHVVGRAEGERAGQGTSPPPRARCMLEPTATRKWPTSMLARSSRDKSRSFLGRSYASLRFLVIFL